MRESYWGYWIVILGVFVIVIMMLISNVTTTNTQDYYLIKEVTEQSMVDAVDLGYYRNSGELKINAERFVESFLRRFSENVAFSTYQVDFYGIYEAPPKVSVKVTTKSASYNIGADTSSFDIVNKVDAILELDGQTSAQVSEIDGVSNREAAEKNKNNAPEIPVSSGSSNSTTNNNSNNSNNSSSSNVNRPSTNTSNEVDYHHPTRGNLGAFVVMTMRDKYYVCTPTTNVLPSKCKGTNVIKSEYKNNGNAFIEVVINDWQAKYNVTLSADEKAEFATKFKQEFYSFRY